MSPNDVEDEMQNLRSSRAAWITLTATRKKSSKVRSQIDQVGSTTVSPTTGEKSQSRGLRSACFRSRSNAC
jgi:hypothetical protein